MNREIDRLQLGAFAFLGSVTILSVLAAFQTGLYYLSFIPFALIVIYTAVVNFKLLYFVLMAAIPLSMEYSFSPSLGTDLPDEPLMVGLMLVTIAFVVTNYRAVPTGYFAHFLIVALLIHLAWIFIASVHSVNVLISLKVFLAKIWYVVTFSVLSAIVIRTKADIHKIFWCVFIPLTLLVIRVLIKQYGDHFSFDEVNRPMWPFFRNHVNYAAILSVFFPFILLARTWYKSGSKTKRLLNFSIVLYLVAIYLSYTRTAYIAVAAILPIYFAVRYRLMKYALAAVLIGGTFVLVHIFHKNNYLEFAPQYTETIYHDDFSQHLSSTFEGKDVSSMERVYRWVAATHMFKEHPWMGFGPGNFYPYYKRYTVIMFQTYVSDNPERSTTHNYPLLLLTEQGAIGLGIFVFLTLVIFIYGEAIYHRLRDAEEKQIALTLLIILGMIYVNLFLSDLLESDKVGPFFFICISLLAAMDIRNRQLLKAERQ